MPDELRALAVAASKRHKGRSIPPQVRHGGRERPRSVMHDCPYRDEDWSLWVMLFLDTFGAGSMQVADAFFHQLAALCPDVLYEGEERARTDEEALRQAIAIVYGIKPRNEIETCLAAQAVALHFASMKIGERIGRYSYVEPRDAAALARLSKAFANNVQTIQALRGRKSAKQLFVVKKETHVHYHADQHLHPGEGGQEIGGQPHAAVGSRSAKNGGCPALPSSNEGGEVVSLSIREGQAPLPDARGGQGLGRSEG